MGKSQQTKGKTGEREVVHILEAHGFMARRGQVWNGEPDIVCPVLQIHFEVKRHEKLELDKWFTQSLKDCGDKIPTVVFRQNYHPWTIAIRTGDFLGLVTGTDSWLDGEWLGWNSLMTMQFDSFLDIVEELIA